MDKDELLNAKKWCKESKDRYVLYWDAKELQVCANSCHCNIYPANLCFG